MGIFKNSVYGENQGRMQSDQVLLECLRLASKSEVPIEQPRKRFEKSKWYLKGPLKIPKTKRLSEQ